MTAIDALGDCFDPGADIVRLAGAARYQTATAVAERLFSGHRGVLLATAQNWPDGIAASPSSRIGLSTGSAWPLLLTTSPPLGDPLGPVLHTTVRDYLANNTAIDHGYVLGGLAPVGRRAFNDLDGRL